jgi:hypothetical protein
MGFGDHWDRAIAAARQEISKLGASDRGSVVYFGSSADIQMRTTAENARLNAAVTAAKPRPSSDAFRAGAESRGQHPG